PAGAFLGGVGGRFISEIADGALVGLLKPLTITTGYKAFEYAPVLKMTPAAACLLHQRKKITDELLDERFRWGGFEPIEQKFQYDSMRPFPTIPDLVVWARYHGDPDNVWSTLLDKVDIDSVDFPVWEWLGKQRLTTMQVQTLFRRGIIEKFNLHDQLARIGWSEPDRENIELLGWSIPNAMLLVQGNLQQEVYDDKILSDISVADIHPDYAQLYLDAVLTKPSSQDLIAYHLRRDPGLADLDADLKKIGIHPAYNDVYRT
ncbi:unnamed protein product, partial [marine sediment metagenome]